MKFLRKRHRCANPKCDEWIAGGKQHEHGPGTSGWEFKNPRQGRYVCDSCWFAISRTFSYTVSGATIVLGIGYALAKWLWP